MYMDWTYECLTEIDEFDPARGLYLAEIYSCADNRGFDHLSYDIESLPTTARYTLSQLHLSLAIRRNSQELTSIIGPERSIAEFSATFERHLTDTFLFQLYDEGDEWAGYGQINETPLPTWLTSNDGGNCFVTIQLQYAHDLAKENKGYSGQEIKESQERIRQDHENWKTNTN